MVLIDGSWLTFRAFFAIPSSFSTSDGLPTNAVYGFATMFRKLLAGKQARYGAVVFDAKGPSERNELFAEYKANRPEMADELVQQLPHIDRLVRAHGFPLIRIPGVEADDIIGSLATLGAKRELEVLIISGDKDFAQLIGPRIRLFDTMKDVIYDAELAKLKWGIPPSQMIDYLAMVGDSVDNIPGVRGVGPKTAQTLLETYGSLEGVLANVNALKGKTKERFIEHREIALLSKTLATINCALPLELSLEALELPAVETAQLNELFRELEFYSLIADDRRIEQQTAEANATLVRDESELLAWLPEDAPVALHFCFQFGQFPTEPELLGLALAREGAAPLFVPLPQRSPAEATAAQLPRALSDFLASDKAPKIVHNAKQLMRELRRLGIELRGVHGDAYLAGFLLDPAKTMPHELSELAKEYLHRAIPTEKLALGRSKYLSELPIEKLASYSATLALVLLELWPELEALLHEREQYAHLFQHELPISQLLARMELDGIFVDGEDLARLSTELGARLARLETEIHELAGHPFNIGSTKQLAEVLFEELKLPAGKKTKTGYSTDIEVLEGLVPKHPIAARLIEHRKLAKLISTYTDALPACVNPRSQRIHCTYQQGGASTGRLITTDPDLQRTPVKTEEGLRIRRTFVAPPGHLLISADWSQIELRLLAHFSGDHRLVDAFQKGLDVHARTAGQLFDMMPELISAEQRAIGKQVNFATIYGQGPRALALSLGIPHAKAKAYITRYFEVYAEVRQWLDQTIAQAKKLGYVSTILGRRRYIPELYAKSPMDRQAGERIAANTPIQGSAADICKLAMLSLQEELDARGLRSRLVLQIHDELLLECPEQEVEDVATLVREIMQSVVALAVPLTVDVGIGANWADAKA
jgi:DNA polymerase-1